ncbi:MAG: ATP-binding cassette domain-containing protein [Treponema sp.]|nr:ATP-binding cassette domain-containing protein [Treponema sp.]
MVELKKIHKYFSSNGVTALDGADFNLHEGEIHVLLGENGAGKSTLMHIMAGFMKPGGEGFHGNPGKITINGKEKRFASTSHSLAAGIGMVRQHPHQIPGFPVWENCITGSRKHPPLFVNRQKYRNRVSDLNEQLNFNLPMDGLTDTLSVSQRQKAAILTLLLRKIQFLIFDEPTAILSSAETEKLFDLLALLRDEGKGIVLISHKLEEALRIADRLTILRQGKTQICCKPFELSNKELYHYIFGAESGDLIHQSSYEHFSALNGVSSVSFAPAPKKTILALENFKVNVPGHPLIRRLNLEVEQGTIMGIAGVRDSGLETLELALTGFLPFKGKLQIDKTELSGAEKNTAKRVSRFRSAGGCYLGQRIEGEYISIRDVLLIHAYRRFHKFGIMNLKEINKWTESVMEAAKVPQRKRASASAFSGGQLQRLLLTREMAECSTLMVLSEPSGGLDLRYRKRLASLLREKANEHTAVVIFSTDVEELMKLSDSVAVLHDGIVSRIVKLKNVSRPQKVKEIIQAAMVGNINTRRFSASNNTNSPASEGRRSP